MSRLHPYYVLNARWEFDYLFRERIEKHPTGDHRHVLNATIAAGKLYANTDVRRIDTRNRRQ